MFKVGKTIVYEDGKVYDILDEVQKDFGNGPTNYFVLQENEVYGVEKPTTVFASVATITKKARDLISHHQAKKILSEISDIEVLWINDCKQRKIIFSEYIASKDLIQVVKVLKSFYIKEIELRDKNKSLTITDRRLMERVKADFIAELSIVLKKTWDEIEDKIIIEFNK